MDSTYSTPRLTLQKLTENDHTFISELVNTPEWLKFIGNGNPKTYDQVTEYIQKIVDNPNCTFWVVRLIDGVTPIGVITFMKRTYLEHFDIGFAFLPGYVKQGFAYEATAAVLRKISSDTIHTHILATTIPENINSIRLLEKIGLGFDKEIERDSEKLLLYSAEIAKISKCI